MTAKRKPTSGNWSAATGAARFNAPLNLGYHDSGSRSIPIRASGGKVVGAVVGDVFKKRVRSTVHFLRKPQAIAFDTSTLLDAQRHGAQWVEVFDLDAGRTYRASVHHVLHDGFTLDRGFGAQVALPLEKWNRDGDLVGEQLALSFGGGA